MTIDLTPASDVREFSIGCIGTPEYFELVMDLEQTTLPPPASPSLVTAYIDVPSLEGDTDRGRNSFEITPSTTRLNLDLRPDFLYFNKALCEATLTIILESGDDVAGKFWVVVGGISSPLIITPL